MSGTPTWKSKTGSIGSSSAGVLIGSPWAVTPIGSLAAATSIGSPWAGTPIGSLAAGIPIGSPSAGSSIVRHNGRGRMPPRGAVRER